MENTNIEWFWKENIEKIKKIFWFYIGDEILLNWIDWSIDEEIDCMIGERNAFSYWHKRIFKNKKLF